MLPLCAQRYGLRDFLGYAYPIFLYVVPITDFSSAATRFRTSCVRDQVSLLNAASLMLLTLILTLSAALWAQAWARRTATRASPPRALSVRSRTGPDMPS